MRKLALILLLAFSPVVIGQNWIARLAVTLPADDPYRLQNGPTNWAVEWIPVGTNLSVASYFSSATAGSNYTFVGNQSAKDAFIAARTTPTWTTWNSATGGLFAANVELTNSVLNASNNLLVVRALFQSNLNFMLTVATNRPALVMTNNGGANLVLSNQIVVISRLLNQIAPMLRDAYQGN